MGAPRELNVIRVAERVFLVTGGSGEAVHLAREARSGELGRPPFDDWLLDPDEAEGRGLRSRYAAEALANPGWADTTLCGRQWLSMESDWDEGSADDVEDVTGPTCRQCLAAIDKLFPEPERDARFPLVVQLVTDTVLEHGSAENHGVPGDQQAALRKEVRAVVRKRTGHRMTTYAHESMVIFVCQPIYDQHAEQRGRAIAEAISQVIETGEPTAEPPVTRLSWDAWATE